MRDDATSPDQVDAESVASMSRGEAMDTLNLNERQYDRMMRDVEPFVGRRNDREGQDRVTIPCLVLRRDHRDGADISDRRR